MVEFTKEEKELIRFEWYECIIKYLKTVENKSPWKKHMAIYKKLYTWIDEDGQGELREDNDNI